MFSINRNDITAQISKTRRQVKDLLEFAEDNIGVDVEIISEESQHFFEESGSTYRDKGQTLSLHIDTLEQTIQVRDEINANIKCAVKDIESKFAMLGQSVSEFDLPKLKAVN